MIDREHDLPITRFWRSAVVAFVICRAPYFPPTSRSCGVSISCNWSSHSPARGCWEVCWLPRLFRPPARMG